MKVGGGKTTTLWTKASDLIDDIKCKLAQKNSIPVKERQQSSSLAEEVVAAEVVIVIVALLVLSKIR